MPNLKLNKIFGKFILNKKDGNKTIEINNIGEDIFGFTYSNYKECSVCYSMTYSETSCNHHLCIDCWSKIKNDLCPICRNTLVCYL